MSIIERLEAVARKAYSRAVRDGKSLATHESCCLNEIQIELRNIVLIITKGPSEGAILAAEQAYHDAPDSAAHVTAIADAIRAAWAVDLMQENHVEF